MRCGKRHQGYKQRGAGFSAALKTRTVRVVDMKSCQELGVEKDSVVHVLSTSDAMEH